MNGMTSAAAAIEQARAISVAVNQDSLTVDLEDGRTIVVPIVWYPRLANATPQERGNFALIGQGTGISWDDLDEDISIAGIILGRMSGESPASFARWLAARQR